jgi:iron(III) transport system substrate-binding protein
MKKLIALFLLFAVAVTGCTQKPTEQDNPFAEWLKNANLDAVETAERLYAAALSEDMLIVYSTSTRIMDVAASFEMEYPGLLVRVVHMREGELYDKLLENYEARDFFGDVIISADGAGIMTNELIPRGIAVKYAPYDIADKILPGNNETLLMLAGEASMLQYNDSYYSEPPIYNWWELTEEKWRGMVYMSNPVRSITTLAFLCIIIENSDMMAQAYEDLYGYPLEIPPGENAGQIFIKRLVDNDVVIVNSSDEVAEEIGFPGSLSPSLGIAISSKTRLQGLGYGIVNHFDIEPFAGAYTSVSVMMAGGARNVNTAKLFIRWILGEADGQGEGYKPYMQSGAWSVRSDVLDDTGVRSNELSLLYTNRDYMYAHHESFIAFWERLLEENK